MSQIFPAHWQVKDSVHEGYKYYVNTKTKTVVSHCPKKRAWVIYPFKAKGVAIGILFTSNLVAIRFVDSL